MSIVHEVWLGVKSGNDNKLQWSTFQEVNSDHFDVEHSFDGITFTKLSKSPIVFLTSQYEKNKTHCSFADSTVEHGKKYYYKEVKMYRSRITEMYIEI